MMIVLIAAGGGIGAVLRYVLSKWNSTFPYGTLMANVLAALMIGFLIPSLKEGHLYAFFVTGFCGSLSTVSTFALEVVTKKYSLRYMAVTGMLTLLAVFIGYSLSI